MDGEIMGPWKTGIAPEFSFLYTGLGLNCSGINKAGKTVGINFFSLLKQALFTGQLEKKPKKQYSV